MGGSEVLVISYTQTQSERYVPETTKESEINMSMKGS